MADIVARITTGKSAFSIGSGNPGMANIMTNVSFVAGVITLLGDAVKCLVAAALCFVLFPGLHAGRICFAYCSLGLVLGHDYPFWHFFKGGKGVTTTCMGIMLFEPLWGLISCIIGMMTVFSTGYLPLGGVIIPSVFLFYAVFCTSPDIIAVYAVVALLSFIKHRHGLIRIKKGEEKKILKIW
jgi:glycerol-3-phosphate acyltransferase PlsY